MKRVTGVGGIFFRSADPERLAKWYHDHLGVPVDAGQTFAPFRWRDDHDGDGMTVWSPFEKDTTYFGADVPFMINYRVDNLDALLVALRAEGVAVDDKREDTPDGRFAWLSDPDGNRIELWEPPAATAE